MSLICCSLEGSEDLNYCTFELRESFFSLYDMCPVHFLTCVLGFVVLWRAG